MNAYPYKYSAYVYILSSHLSLNDGIKGMMRLLQVVTCYHYDLLSLSLQLDLLVNTLKMMTVA